MVKVIYSKFTYRKYFNYLSLVPLHVLHTRWNSDADSDDDWRCNRTTTIQTHRMSSSVPSSSKVHKHLR